MTAAARPYPSFPRAAWQMALLFLCANLYNVDRLIVGVLADQIKADIHITDVQMSLLIGLAYAGLSVVSGLFLGLYIDRANRRTVVALSLTVWSLATLCGGLSASFGWLFLSRAVVGMGEAALAPGAMSLIADLFPPGRRGRALALYSIGATFGSALATLIPGLITGADLHLRLPIFDILLTPWRVTFVLCGLAGPVVAFLLWFTTREPERQGLIARTDPSMRAGFQVNFGYIGAHASIFVPYLLGMGLFYLAYIGVSSWTAVFITRHFGLSLAQIAGPLSLTLLISGIAGYLTGGVVADAGWMRRAPSKFWIMIASPLLALPAAFAVMAPSLPAALMMLATISFASPVINVGSGAIVQDVIPNNMRGFTLSLVTLATTILGMLSGPLAVALATDRLFHDPLKIGWSLLVVALPMLLVSSACFRFALSGLRRHIGKGSLVAEVIRVGGA